MRSPLRPLPATVERWIATARVLRWLDAFAGWLAVWGVAAMVFPIAAHASLAVLAALVTALGAFVRAVRVRWRPVSGAVTLVLSGRLSAGDQAWYVGPGHAERVLVTARHRTRVVIVRLNDESAEGFSVRRTRVLLVPADPDRRRGE
jgi:hypothetical protein